MAAAILLYDDGCGFCRWSADKIRAWDRHGRLSFSAIQSPAGNELLSDIEPSRRLESWHLSDQTGRVWSAGAAIPPLLRLLPMGRGLAAVAELWPDLTERAYRSVAQHRERLASLVGRRACSVDPSRPLA